VSGRNATLVAAGPRSGLGLYQVMDHVVAGRPGCNNPNTTDLE
jgi:hypothetical protein